MMKHVLSVLEDDFEWTEYQKSRIWGRGCVTLENSIDIWHYKDALNL